MTFISSSGITAIAETLPSDTVTNVKHPGGPIRVLHLINDLSVGGAEMMLYRLLSQTRRDRFDSVVLSMMDQGSLRQRIEDLGIPVYTARMKAGMATPASIWRLIRLVRKIKPDLIQGWLYHGSLAAQLAGMFASAKAPVIWGIHSTYSLPLEKKLTAAIVKLCAPLSRLSSSIVFVSRTSQSQHKAKGYFSGNSCVIPNGIDTTLFAPSNKARVSVRAELGLSTDALLVGVIGRHHPMKDQANFLRAAGQISKRYGEAHFLLAGRSVDVDNRTLLKLIEELKLDDHVHLLGERTDIVRLVAALDIFCLSSCYGESFPVIVGEAMSCAVPCVVTDVGDSAWMVSDTGRFVPPRDTGALAAACEEFLDIGPAGRQAMGAAARSRVTELFSLPSVVARYEELYENSIATVVVIGKASEMAYQSLSGVSTDKNA